MVDRLLAELATLSSSEGFRLLAAALQRARRIVPAGVKPGYDPARLVEAQELALHERVEEVRGRLDGEQDLAAFTEVAAAVVAPVNAFFDGVYVMADDPELRATRLGLLATVRDLGAGIVDWDALRL